MKRKVVLLIALLISIGMYTGTELVWPHSVEAGPGCQSCR
jgi:hypothetical protein